MATSQPSDVTRILARLADGDPQAEGELYPLVYGELRRLAAGQLRGERRHHTLQPTALVHEAYLRLVEQRKARWTDRAYFFGVAATMMRRILVNHAKARKARKRGGDRHKVPLDEVLVYAEERCVDVEALDEALTKLAVRDHRRAKVVELRFFGGLAVDETAEVLGIASRTVKEDWRIARAWLYSELGAA